MDRFDDNELDLGPGLDPGERESLIALAERLERERPVVAPRFRGELRRSLIGRLEGRGKAPDRLRALILANGLSGTVMLAVAALGVAGIGPLAAG
ncbi:MAG: hypothetical protein U0R26_10670 [Solirubrobacterales bacterium]